ncbi:hypothetical protein [Brevibacillus reuszeri]|uniref:hypothetical protein n=1 Tax=Brevibacillus reuszeri TaxID=54915 RepID=UPI003D2276C9
MNWLKKRLPSKESFLALYATVYSLALISLMFYCIFSQRSVFEKIIISIVMVIMALKLPTPEAPNQKQKNRSKKGNPVKSAVQAENQGIKKRKRRKRTSAKKATGSKHIQIGTLSIDTKSIHKKQIEEELNKPAPKTIKPLSTPIHELTESRRHKDTIRPNSNVSSSHRKKKLPSVVETNEKKQFNLNPTVEKETVHIEVSDKMDLAKEPENIGLILSTLRSRVAANVEMDRIVDITHMREQTGTWATNDSNLHGFDSVTGHPTSITVKCVSVQSDVARLEDTQGELRWVKMPEGVNHSDLQRNQEFEVQLIKTGSKYKALKVTKLVG